MPPEDWRRAAEAVEARMSELGIGRGALARAAEVDRKTVDNFLDRGAKPRTDKRGGYERALLWSYGSLLALARGGEPIVTEKNPRPVAEVDRAPVGLGLDDAAADLTDDDIEDIRALIDRFGPQSRGGR